ncbi:hypothetical protein ABTZ99_26085 [Actinosynnema sp. NPDC002837]
MAAKSTGDASPGVHNDMSGDFHGTVIGARDIGRVTVASSPNRFTTAVAMVLAGAAGAVVAALVMSVALGDVGSGPQVTVVTVVPAPDGSTTSSSAETSAPTTQPAAPTAPATSGVREVVAPPVVTTVRTTANPDVPTATSTTTAVPTAAHQCTSAQGGNGVVWPRRMPC